MTQHRKSEPKTVKDERGRQQPADKKRARQSAKEGPAAYAPHQEGDLQQADKTELAPAVPGDERTPEKKIGQVKYSDKAGSREGGAGEPQTSDLEPEKQGGIGGP